MGGGHPWLAAMPVSDSFRPTGRPPWSAVRAADFVERLTWAFSASWANVTPSSTTYLLDRQIGCRDAAVDEVGSEPVEGQRLLRGNRGTFGSGSGADQLPCLAEVEVVAEDTRFVLTRRPPFLALPLSGPEDLALYGVKSGSS